jgi:hypothetical protein
MQPAAVGISDWGYSLQIQWAAAHNQWLSVGVRHAMQHDGDGAPPRHRVMD